MRLRPYSTANPLPLKWKKSADYFLQSIAATTTYSPALYLGSLEEFGVVEADRRADRVLREGNPLEDIANTRRSAGVMVPGCYYSRAGLDLMLEEVA